MYTYYTRLGVTENATLDEIKRAYRRKAIDFHPDKNGNSQESKEEFIKIQRAYECLSDEGKRKEYDARLRVYRERIYRENNLSSQHKASSNHSTTNSGESSVPSLVVLCMLIVCVSLFADRCDDSSGRSVPTSRNHEEISDPNHEVINTTEYEEYFYDNGDMPYAEYWGRGSYDASSLSYLRVLNYSGQDAVVLLQKKYSGRVIRNVYVKSMSSYKINKIPEGVYSMKVMYGNSWNREKYNGADFPKGGFMKNVSYSSTRDNEEFDFYFERDLTGINYPTWEVTLHKVKDGNMRTKNISKNDFFE